MASRSLSYTQLLGLLSFILLLVTTTTTTTAVRVGVILHKPSAPTLPVFREAPAFRNGDQCGTREGDRIHIAMTLDTNYLRGTMAAVLSLLQHSTCPENLSFHFLSLPHFENDLFTSIKSTFPYLNFKIYQFDPNLVRSKISKSIRQALDQPLNYARIYLADIIPSSVDRIIYLDSDLVVVDDIEKLWDVEMEGKVVAAPEYCHANFTHYFTKAFWSDRELVKVLEGKRPCYFNTGVMVVDVDKWRKGMYTQKVEDWMTIQKQKRIYHLGSLPPFLLIFAGDIKAVNHRWNQHGLGGDNFEGKCRTLHPGPISLLHWSGKGKPWLRLDSRKPCIVDHLWAPYDQDKEINDSILQDSPTSIRSNRKRFSSTLCTPWNEIWKRVFLNRISVSLSRSLFHDPKDGFSYKAAISELSFHGRSIATVRFRFRSRRVRYE